MKSKVKMNIKRVDGQWYAFVSGGTKRERNLALYISIAFCSRLNLKAGC